MAMSATWVQCPMGILPCSARKDHVRQTLARVYEVWSRARSISVSSRCCMERSRAMLPAVRCRVGGKQV